jgi:hypothetical protein
MHGFEYYEIRSFLSKEEQKFVIRMYCCRLLGLSVDYKVNLKVEVHANNTWYLEET